MRDRAKCPFRGDGIVWVSRGGLDREGKETWPIGEVPNRHVYTLPLAPCEVPMLRSLLLSATLALGQTLPPAGSALTEGPPGSRWLDDALPPPPAPAHPVPLAAAGEVGRPCRSQAGS